MLENKLNLEEEKMSAMDVKLEKQKRKLKYSDKLPEGFRDEMSKDASGNPISGKMPIYLVKVEESGDIIGVQRTDDNANGINAPTNFRGQRDMLPFKGIQDVKEEIINSSYAPQPHMTDVMKKWEFEFDQGSETLREERK
jgi:hypothetical protein